MEAHTIDTASGRKIDFDEPDASQIALEDIAGGLSRICRFGAQSVRFHSVAQHAILVSRLVNGGRPDRGLAALHHDSHEAYVCDIPKPLKLKMTAAGEEVYEQVCEALDDAIFRALGISTPTAEDWALIKAADNQALMIEAAALLPDQGAGISAARGFPRQEPGLLEESLAPEEARRKFLEVHASLIRLRRESSHQLPEAGSIDGGVHEFRDSDPPYLEWVAAHPDGYVINILRSLSPSTARLHRATCSSITGTPRNGRTWIGTYIKICAGDVKHLDRWATAHAGTVIPRCGTCRPGQSDGHPVPTAARASRRRGRPPKLSGTPNDDWEIDGPGADRPLVQAWIDDYIRFERRPAGQEQLRMGLRNSIRGLKAASGQVLHATFFGFKPASADVENLALYNLDDTGRTFQEASRFGLRFELGGQPPTAPSGQSYEHAYRYELVDWLSSYRHWRPGRELASWDWVDIGKLSSEKKLEPVWLALRRSAARVESTPRQPDTPFTVHVAVRPPRGRRAALAYLLKPLLDGVICAFQAHTSATDLSELAIRVARTVPAAPELIETLLCDERQAVLGAVPRLLHKRGEGVQWSPADNLCVAAELTAAEPAGATWAIQGTIVELQPAASS